MNFLKKWKRFWTLDRHHDAGFTLVELIVVIAILAILGGVAVPAYSGYVKKANMQADISLAAEVEQALILAYYGGALEEGFSGGSVVLSLEGARVDGDTALEEAMKKAFGEGWEALKLKYDGWKNTKGNIKVALQNSNFADAEGNLNMELLGAVDNLTGQLGDVMSTLDWSSFAGFTGFLTENGIDQNTDPQMAANSAVLYLSQTSMDPEKREDVANQLVQHFGQNTHYNDANEVEINLYDFMVNMTTSQTCTEFETLAMVYAAMAGYCLQKGEDTYNEFISMDLLSKDAEGNPTVGDEGDVLRALEAGFGKILAEEDENFTSFYNYLSNELVNDVNAYYGVIDGISENQDYLRENLDGSENFYSSQQNFLSAYWNVDIASGEVAVLLTMNGNNQPQVGTVGMGE